MDAEYGTRLYGYCTSSSSKGLKLKRYERDWDGKEHETKLGVIKSSEKVTHGPVTITIWTLENGAKYHYIH